MKQSFLFVGHLNSCSRSLQRYNALIRLGVNATGLSFERSDTMPGISAKPGLWSRIRYRLGVPIDETEINRRILEKVRVIKPHCVWIEKALMVRPATLKKVRKLFPNIKIVFFSEDDMFGKHNQSKYFLSCLPLYDIVITTKSINLNPEELPALGAKKVIFVKQAFDPSIHRPIKIHESDHKYISCDVSFIGTFELDRIDKLVFLAESGLKVRVWGNGWSKYVGRHPNLKIENIPIYGDEYVKAICASRINLCFLRKVNRDLHTSRSLEIPACGGFMLAERTSDHQDLFEEGREAVFFDIDNDKELLDKTRYYLEHEEERKSIARAGRERCLKSGYSHHERLTQIFKQIFPENY